MESSIVPSGPKPTKEAYLTTLRVLRENHKVAEDGATGSNRRAQLFTGEEARITAAPEDVHGSDTHSDPPNSFLANIALGGRSERRNIPMIRTELTSIDEMCSKAAPKNSVVVSPRTVIASTPTKSPSNAMNSDSYDKLKRSPKVQSPRLSNGSEQIIKFGRKATRRFTMVSNLLPKYRIDDKAKQKIAAALKEINCWSDDDDYEAVKKLRAIEEDSDLSSDSESEFSLEALASQKHPPSSVKANNTTLAQSNLVSIKYRGLQAQSSSKTASLETTPQGQGASAKERADLVRPKHTIIQTKQQSVKHAYLEQQKELQRQKAKELIVKKAVKLIIKLRAEEESQQQRSLLAVSNNLSTLVRLSIESIATARVNKILKQAMNLAVERRIKLDRRAKRRLIRQNRASSEIFRFYRKYRVRMLLFCVVNDIRAKALHFKNQEIREEREYRMRTAMRRVREDAQFREWKGEQAVRSTFPVKPPPSEFAPIIAFTRKNLLCNNFVEATVLPETVAEESVEHIADSQPPLPSSDITIVVPKNTTFLTEMNQTSSLSTPRPPSSGDTPKFVKSPRIKHASPSPGSIDTLSTGIRTAASTPLTSPRAATTTTPGAAVVAKSAEQLREQREFQYHRPDLAPFSTMINNMTQRGGLFKASAAPSWTDIASVSADFGKQSSSTAATSATAQAAKKLKSPAYAALEKFCGVTQEDLERRKLAKRQDLVNLKLKSFGHSIVSL